MKTDEYTNRIVIEAPGKENAGKKISNMRTGRKCMIEEKRKTMYGDKNIKKNSRSFPHTNTHSTHLRMLILADVKAVFRGRGQHQVDGTVHP